MVSEPLPFYSGSRVMGGYQELHRRIMLPEAGFFSLGIVHGSRTEIMCIPVATPLHRPWTGWKSQALCKVLGKKRRDGALWAAEPHFNVGGDRPCASLRVQSGEHFSIVLVFTVGAAVA